jgi:hypothetical protein
MRLFFWALCLQAGMMLLRYSLGELGRWWRGR